MKAKKMGICIGICVALTGCALMPDSRPFGYYTLTNPSSIPTTAKKYQLGSFKLTLTQKFENAEYPNEAKLTDIFKTKLQTAMANKGLIGEGYTLNIDMAYQRIYVGEAFGMHKSFGNASCRHTATLMVGNQVIASMSGDPMKYSSIKEDQKNLFSNLKKIATVTTGTSSPTSELDDIDRCVHYIIEDLPH